MITRVEAANDPITLLCLRNILSIIREDVCRNKSQERQDVEKWTEEITDVITDSFWAAYKASERLEMVYEKTIEEARAERQSLMDWVKGVRRR